jgi:LuxR family transcriptional regulator, maltose regulon positive regulatory protein
MGESTQLVVPAGRRHIIERPRLTKLLDETSARVIMLVAPAGYGKTTLAREWLASKPHAWYEANAAAADIAALALGIADAVASLVPQVGHRLREWLPTSREPAEDIAVLAALLGDELAQWPDDAWFAIDDYHLLSSTAAEALVLRLFVETERRLLLTSRRRPSWSSARRLLYGSFFELGHSSLAMSTEEANDVLASLELEAATGLVALADGWPAVIGLAALAPAPVELEDDLPQALYDFFAEELFASLSAEGRRLLPQLALLPSVTRKGVQTIVGPRGEELLGEAMEVGLLVARETRDFELHPLLRAFLLRKLRELPNAELESAVESVTQAQITASSWDGAFSIIQEFERVDLLAPLIERALVPLTKQGRLATVRRWLEFGRQRGAVSAHLDVAESELLFRQGEYQRAEALASAAAAALPRHDSLKSAAFYRAGQSAYLLDEGTTALRHFRAAERTTDDPTDQRNALWGQFIVSVELERAAARELLKRFTVVSPHDRDTTVRAANGELILAVRNGGIDRAISSAQAITDLVSEATDPIIRSSFWHVYAAALMLSADYEASLEAVDIALHEIAQFSVQFARPHALVNRAQAYIGLRRFREAATTLDEIDKYARKPRDDYLIVNAKALRCRLLLQQGRAEEAVTATSRLWSRPPSSSLRGEYLATRALAFASTGDVDTALALVGQAIAMSAQLESMLLCQWVRAICAVALENDEAESQVRAAYKHTRATGALDAFVFAYRVFPRSLEVLVGDPSFGKEVAELLDRLGDVGLALSKDFPSASRHASETFLTPREREVYALLAKGKRNREIARTLVISESTAKVHVRHVLHKLGVRSRTEAALKAARERSEGL